MANPVKILVVDDTITYRMILKRVVENIPDMVVAATAPNGKLALDKLSREHFDVMLLDVEMPEMDGLTTLQHVGRKHPDLTVVMVSGMSRSNANIVMECLNAGALDFVTKPVETDANRALDALRKDLEPILTLVAKKHLQRQALAPRRPGPARAPAPPLRRPAPAGQPGAVPAAPRPASLARAPKPDLVLIGSSTGGPAALSQVLGGLRRKLPVPTLVVQHMPPVFTASLAAQLSRSSRQDVREAQEGMNAKPGSVLIAMGGRHMTLKVAGSDLVMGMNDGPKVNECRPAVDVLFMSAATTFSGNILAVILTGMGKDGAKGVEALKRMGKTYCITQDRESCVVYGMPRAVDELGLSDESLPLTDIGARIAELCS